ncbi:MAG: Smr/MutS family protein [Desulfovibrionaceae bacterium]|nr:Smr/MutS family protein [Desulfovibrionaceae bacterium]
MSAMRQVSPVKKEDVQGFLLAEQCDLPATRGTQKKSKKQVQPLPQAAPEQPRAAEPEDTEESSLFLQAMSQVDPLQGRGREVAPAPPASQIAFPGEENLQDLLDAKLEFALSFTDEYLEGYVVGLDPMIMNKLRTGTLSPEAHLDLHGLNAVQAFEALRGFMRGAWYKGLRTVLVVPGRGRNSPDGMGILRNKLQAWLTQDPFKRVVLGFCTAQPHDGGPGSVYVLLRKYRKKGRICWERMPADADLY